MIHPFPEIPLQAAPRALDSLPVSFNTGLVGALFFGWFFFAGCLLLTGISLWQGKYGPMVLLVLGSLASLYWLRSTNAKIKFRQEAYQHGKIVRAEVVKLGRQFSALKSERDYTLLVRPAGANGNQTLVNIVHANVGLWNSTEKGAQIVGLEHEGRYFFGESVGLKWQIAVGESK
ncbi:MAG: hypothetical protein AAF399_27500 [Bacteroidota bacterium]